MECDEPYINVKSKKCAAVGTEVLSVLEKLDPEMTKMHAVAYLLMLAGVMFVDQHKLDEPAEVVRRDPAALALAASASAVMDMPPHEIGEFLGFLSGALFKKIDHAAADHAQAIADSLT